MLFNASVQLVFPTVNRMDGISGEIIYIESSV